MKRNTKDERRWKFLHLVSGSHAAKQIVGRRGGIEHALKARHRRVWPLATVARLFGISPSLLRKWAKHGMISLFQRPTDRHRPGLTERAIRQFLKELTAESESGVELLHDRPRPAEERCRKTARDLKPGEPLAPADFAARAGVAVTTVRRLLAMDELPALYPTPHRPKICNWAERYRHCHLTKKRGKKAR